MTIVTFCLDITCILFGVDFVKKARNLTLTKHQNCPKLYLKHHSTTIHTAHPYGFFNFNSCRTN